MLSRGLIGLAGLLLSICAAAQVVTPKGGANAFEQSLLDAQQAYLDAADRNDATYIKKTLTDDFVSIDASGNTNGKADVLEDIDPSEPRDAKEKRAILYDFKVVQLNENAGVVSYNAVHPGSRPRYQHVSTAWMKQDGQWKLKFKQSTPNMWSASDFD
jgi:hypothetical protein